MSRAKFYKPVKQHEPTEEQAARRKKLFLDKRVKHVMICDNCGGPLTQAEARRNGGVCDTCAQS